MKQDVQSTVAVAIIVLTLSVHVAFILTLRNLQKTFTPDLGRVYPMERPQLKNALSQYWAAHFFI